MGNVILISLYQGSESSKELLYHHFLNLNINPEDPIINSHSVSAPNAKTEILEIPSIKTHIIDFINQNLDTLSESHFTQLVKKTLNSLHEKNPKREFKFVFFVPFSKLDLGFSALKSLFDSSNRRIANSMFLIVNNDSGEIGTVLTDNEVFQKSVKHQEIEHLKTLSERDNLVMNLPKKDKYKDHLLQALKLEKGCFLNNYSIEKARFEDSEGKLVIGNDKVEIVHNQAELRENPRIDQHLSQLSNLVIGDFNGDYQRIQNEGEHQNRSWMYVLAAILVLVLLAVLYHSV